MVDFDLLDTSAGREIYELGGVDAARAMIIEGLMERFGDVSAEIIDTVVSIENGALLRKLHKQTYRCGSMDEFAETMASLISP